MKIIVISNFARSGGTLLTQLLNTFESVWVLSEISTQAGATPDHRATSPEAAIVQQASQWFGVDLKSDIGLVEVIKELGDAATSQGKTLVIREWSYQNFAKTKQNDFQPSGRLDLVDCLSDTFELIPVAFVRDGIDVFLSMRGDLVEFASVYCAYAESTVARGLPVLKYEDLVASPSQFEQTLAELTGLDWKFDVDGYKKSPATGDLQLGNVSRGIRSNKISALPRKRVSYSLVCQIESCEPLMKANRLFGYPESYLNGNVEGLIGMLARRGTNRTNKILQAASKKVSIFFRQKVH